MARQPEPGAIDEGVTPPFRGSHLGVYWPSPDRPITSGDQDMLGRERFAKRVAAVITELRQVEESSVLAIVGPWGSGKSSVINLACAELTTLDSSWKVRPARIWAPPDVSGLIAELFAAIRSALPDGERGSTALDLLGKYAPLVTPALSLVPVIGNVIQGVADNATGLLASRQQRPMQQLLDELSRELEKLSLRILVVLDDVDRLQPDELLMLFKAIRQVAPFPGVYYLLAYDEQTVIDILTGTPIANHSQDRALAYLEKIVQVPLAMPPVEYYYARKLLTDGLNATLLHPRWLRFTDEQDARFRDLYAVMLHRTLAEPRAVNRFLRQVTAYLPLIDPAELDLVDLLTLIHLRSFAPATYRLLARSRAALTSAEPPPDQFRGALNRCLQSECGDVRDEVQAALAGLFPALLDISGDVTRDELEFLTRQEGKRVSVGEYFDRYFLLGLAITDVPDATARDALPAIARDETGEARIAIEKRLHADDPAAVSAALRKLTRFTETDGLFLDAMDLGVIARYVIDQPALWDEPVLAEDAAAWAAAALARASRVGPRVVVPGLTDELDELGLLRLCMAVERAQQGIRDHDHLGGLVSLRGQVASAVEPHLLAHLHEGDQALADIPFASFAAFVADSGIRDECAQKLVAGLDAGEYTIADLAARFIQVAESPDDQEQLIGIAADPLITLMGLTELGYRCDLMRNSAAAVVSFDELDATWEGRRKAGLFLLTAELQKRRAVPPAPPTGVLKRTEQSMLWDSGPLRWASRPELTQASPGAPGPVLCIRAAVLLPGGSQGFPRQSPATEIPDEQRAKVIQETLQKSLLTNWSRAVTHTLGVEAEPRWEETGYTTPSFAGFDLSYAGQPESPRSVPLRAHCTVTSGPAVAGGPDGLALALDLLIDMPFPPEGAVQDGEVPSAAPTGLGPSVSPWPAPELESVSGLVQMMTNSAIPAARTAASRLLDLNVTDGNVGVWLAATTSFGEILSLDQFPVVPGTSPGPNEASAFARLPLEPGEHLDTGPSPGSVRGLAVHLIDQLLQQEHRRGYAETLHALRGPANSR